MKRLAFLIIFIILVSSGSSGFVFADTSLHIHSNIVSEEKSTYTPLGSVCCIPNAPIKRTASYFHKYQNADVCYIMLQYVGVCSRCGAFKYATTPVRVDEHKHIVN